VSAYFKLVFWLTVLLLITWKFLPQQMNDGFLPLVIAIAVRSWVLSKKNNHGKKGVSLSK
jgi:hypothetical protein